jgi:hypothetical protein
MKEGGRGVFDLYYSKNCFWGKAQLPLKPFEFWLLDAKAIAKSSTKGTYILLGFRLF